MGSGAVGHPGSHAAQHVVKAIRRGIETALILYQRMEVHLALVRKETEDNAMLENVQVCLPLSSGRSWTSICKLLLFSSNLRAQISPVVPVTWANI